MKRSWAILLASAVLFLGLEAAVFRSGLYASYVSPESTTGNLESRIENELARPKEHPNQILGIGDSRMALVPRVADNARTGYEYGSVALAGSTPRTWYYTLREVDPRADRYRAIVIGIETFDDQDPLEDYSVRESDLNYLLGRLRYSDLREFSSSYPEPAFEWRAARGILLKGTIYQRDFQEFLHDPRARVQMARLTRRESHNWIYDYVDTAPSLAGLTVDWETKTIAVPAGVDPGMEALLKGSLVGPLPPQTGRHGAYLRHWLGKLYEHYHGSRTRLIFVRLPRAPWIRPDLPKNPASSVRELAKEPNVTLLPEDRFNGLEAPEFFRDYLHMTQAGLDQFSNTVAQEVLALLGPPL